MQKFLVLYMAPQAELEEWMKQDASVRKADEDNMMAKWDQWMAKQGAKLGGMTAGAGKTKRVTSEGIADVKNDVMLASMIESESHAVLAQAFEGHPHFGITGGWIDIMPLNELPGMGS